MPTTAQQEAAANTDRFYTVIKSMHAFDTIEVNGVVQSILSPTPREECLVGTYYRALGNVGTLLRLDKSKDFQAIVMLARALFELTVDIKLLDVIANGWIKMLAYADLEKMRSASKIIKFKTENPASDIDTAAYESFIARNGQRVTALRKST